MYFLTNEHDFSESDKKTIQVESPNQAASGQTIQPDLPESDKKTIQVESPSTTASEESIQREGKRSYQRISESGRIYVSKKGWLLRFTILALLIGITSYYTLYGITIGNTFVVYSNILLVYSVIIWVVGGFFSKVK